LLDDLWPRIVDRRTRDDVAELDHLAARMRRNADNLIVLSGAEPSRRWRGPVPVREVVEAAAAEVKERARVQLQLVDDVRVAGQAAHDLTHLLAELIDNAIWFSPPDTKAVVVGQSIPGGYLLEVEDKGVGMSDSQLIAANQRLASPPEEVDYRLTQMLGFFVVGQLASRHGIRVQLRHSWYDGITALVLLPPELVSDPTGGVPAVMERAGAARAGPAAGGERAPLPAANTITSEQIGVRTAAVHLPLWPHKSQAAQGEVREASSQQEPSVPDQAP
jgi:hypothetical protein